MSSWVQRFRARRRINRFVSLWYHPEYDCPSLGQTQGSLGLLCSRGRRILDYLIDEKLIKAKDIHLSPLASLLDLRLFHTDPYLESLSQKDVLASIFNLPQDEVKVDELLTAQRRAVGGTVAALKDLLQDSESISVNLGGGFHHAQPERGAEFCVYNDIAVAVGKLRKNGFKKPIVVIDLDFQQGDGNHLAFAADPLTSIFSIYGSVWSHVKDGDSEDFILSETTTDEQYLDVLTTYLPEFLDSHKAELIIYITGNDVLAEDPMGSFALTEEGVLARDRFIIELARKRHIPLLITLGGGYSVRACVCSVNLLRYLLGCGQEQKISKEDLHEQYSKIAESLSAQELQMGGDRAERGRFLDFYSAYGIELALERYGLFEKLRELGYGDLRITTDVHDPENQVIRVEGKPRQQPGAIHHLLAEMILAKEILPIPGAAAETSPLNLLSVKWILLQDPMKDFSIQNPPLPGQQHPGLGLAKEVQELMVQVCQRLGLDGILIRPNHYHLAVLTDPRFRFLNPKEEGRFEAMQEILKEQALFEATRWVDEGKLQLEDGTVVPWKIAERVCPVSATLTDYFNSRNYMEAVLEEKYIVLEFGIHLVNT